jgi:hypothetical protein
LCVDQQPKQEDEMSKSKRTAKSNHKVNSAKRPSKKRQQKHALPSATEGPPPQTDCPYRPGTLYATLFTEGNREYIAKDELIKKVAELTGKSEKVVGFAYAVLKSPKHRSNKGRSTELVEGDKVKLIANRNRH